MHFAIDPVATGILLLGLLAIGFLKNHFFSKKIAPSLAFSNVKIIQYSSWRSRLAHFLPKLHAIAFGSLLIAFVDPHFLFIKSSLIETKQKTNLLPTEGTAIYLVLDVSGSMSQSVSNGRKSTSKIDLLKNVTQQFIKDHPNDLIGLVSFARVPKVLVPLTLDQETLLDQLNQIQVVQNEDEDGTAMGYAIYKTAQLIAATRHFANDLNQQGKPPYTIKSAVIIVVTDGFQDPSHLDKGNRLRTMELDDAASEVKNQQIHLYVINIDPALSTSQYAAQRRQLQSITTLTGGQFYLVDNQQQLEDIYSAINQLEKGTILKEPTRSVQKKTDFNRFSLYPFFITFGLLTLLIALFIDTFIVKVVP